MTDNTKRLRDIVEKEPQPANYYLSENYLASLREREKRHKQKGNGFSYEPRSLDDVAGAIVCGGMGKEANLIIDKNITDFSRGPRMRSNVNKECIRKLSPREWARLQGFPDDFKFVVSDTHLYRQLGNSVTVPVIREVAKLIHQELEKNESSNECS